MFYSRRIGLANNRGADSLRGGRLTGRMGRYQIGLVDMQTKDGLPRKQVSTNFSVVRVKATSCVKSTIGVLATNRSRAQNLPGSNQFAAVSTAPSDSSAT